PSKSTPTIITSTSTSSVCASPSLPIAARSTSKRRLARRPRTTSPSNASPRSRDRQRSGLIANAYQGHPSARLEISRWHLYSSHMYKTPSQLPEASRLDIVGSLDARLADGLDLHGQLKVAHWNVRGPN